MNDETTEKPSEHCGGKSELIGLVSCGSTVDTISPYDAKYKNEYSGVDIFGRPCTVTAFARLATLIDMEWKHSWHWPDEHNKKLDAIGVSLNDEIIKATDRLNDLKSARVILNNIERDDS